MTTVNLKPTSPARSGTSSSSPVWPEARRLSRKNPPSDASRRAVDLTALDTFIEFKRRVGTTTGGEPDPENVRQLDDYLAQSADQGRIRMGILTDGKRWLLRWPGAGALRLTRPYAFTLEDPDGWFPLYESGCGIRRWRPWKTSAPIGKALRSTSAPAAPPTSGTSLP